MPLIQSRAASSFFGGLLLVFAGQRALGVSADLVPVAMMRLVVDDVDAVVVEQLPAGPLQHLRVGFRRLERFGSLPCRKLRATLGRPASRGAGRRGSW